MGKKAAPEASRLRPRQKRKEMFAELATVKEEMIQQRQSSRPHARRYMVDDSEDQVELEVLEHQNKSLDTICQTVHRLLSKNKVSAKNAFEVPLIDLEQLPDFNQSLENEYAWKRLSSTLQSDYKIYGYRVDAIHSITYNILNTMSRRQQDIEAGAADKEGPAAVAGSQQHMMKLSEESAEGQYLQKKVSNLNLIQLQLVMRMDPVLQRTKRQFDMLGQKSMMLDTLPLDEMLCLQLTRKNEGQHKYPPWGEYNDLWKAEDPLMAFIELAIFRNQVREAFDGYMPEEGTEKGMLDEELAYLLLQQKQNHLEGNHSMKEQYYWKGNRSIYNQISLKHSYLKNQRDLIEDSEKWLRDINQKILGKKNATGVNKYDASNVANPEHFEEDPENIVDFLKDELETRANVFRPDQDKLEHHEDIQDKFLMLPKIDATFDLNSHLLCLREEQVAPKVDETAEAIKETEVDVRRQMVSIIEAKKKIKQQIHSRSTFQNIYNNYCQEQEISPALCFLTLLHLANEHDLTLKQIDGSNFYVY